MTTENRSSQPQGIAAELAASLPSYDPLARRGNVKNRALMIFSALVHAGALFLLWNMLFGEPLEPEETVLVKMVEEKVPEPEPKKARPKVLQRRVLNAAVSRQRDVIRNEVRKLSDVVVQAQVSKVEITEVPKTEAPKQVEQRRFVTKKVNAFSEVTVQQPVSVPQATPSVRNVTQLQQSSGPRLVDAAAPTVSAADYEAPSLTDGVIDNTAVEGDADGARIFSVERGSASKYLDGDGELGLRSGEAKDCMKDPVCLEYLQMIKRRVDRRWNPGARTSGGKVQIKFRVDKSGSAHSIALIQADDDVLGDTCITAFRHASPFPPPPKSIHYLMNKGIIATFDYASGSSE